MVPAPPACWSKENHHKREHPILSGVHLETYSDFDELVNKVNFYLQQEEKRQEIAHNGYALVREQHSVLSRAMEIIREISKT